MQGHRRIEPPRSHSVLKGRQRQQAAGKNLLATPGIVFAHECMQPGGFNNSMATRLFSDYIMAAAASPCARSSCTDFIALHISHEWLDRFPCVLLQVQPRHV